MLPSAAEKLCSAFKTFADSNFPNRKAPAPLARKEPLLYQEEPPGGDSTKSELNSTRAESVTDSAAADARHRLAFVVPA